MSSDLTPLPISAAEQVVVLSFFRFRGLFARAWAFAQMYFARAPLARAAGPGFWKLFGTGSGEGFTPVPNTGVWAVLATFPTRARAEEALAGAPFAAFRARAAEHATFLLRPLSARGAWDGRQPFLPQAGGVAGPVAALTRATLRGRVLLPFWRRVPAIEAAIGANPDVVFKCGLGEVPWVQQVTFSIWPDAASMARFARGGGAHDAAIRAVRAGGWFREELYARFAVLARTGTWNGRDPLVPA